MLVVDGERFKKEEREEDEAGGCGGRLTRFVTIPSFLSFVLSFSPLLSLLGRCFALFSVLPHTPRPSPLFLPRVYPEIPANLVVLSSSSPSRSRFRPRYEPLARFQLVREVVDAPCRRLVPVRRLGRRRCVAAFSRRSLFSTFHVPTRSQGYGLPVRSAISPRYRGFSDPGLDRWEGEGQEMRGAGTQRHGN